MGSWDITVLDTPYLVRERELPSPVVLLSGQGHYWLALDYRGCGPRGNPPVVWIDNEMNHEFLLAPDFRAFVERLTASASFGVVRGPDVWTQGHGRLPDRAGNRP
jgi:hypothetical protein